MHDTMNKEAPSGASTFDPEAWLEAFEEVGGWYVTTGANMTLGWLSGDYTTDERYLAGRSLFRQVERPGPARDALRAFLDLRSRRHGN